jgi:hypothetical protein
MVQTLMLKPKFGLKSTLNSISAQHFSKNLYKLMNIERLFMDCFEYLGVEATYCNKNKETICEIKALVKRPDATYHLGNDGTLTQQIASIEIRSQDATYPKVGDYIKISNKFYRIFEQPLKDSSNMIWEIKAMEI